MKPLAVSVLSRGAWAEGREPAAGTRGAKVAQGPHPARGGRCVQGNVLMAARLGAPCSALPFPEFSYAVVPLLQCPQH